MDSPEKGFFYLISYYGYYTHTIPLLTLIVSRPLSFDPLKQKPMRGKHQMNETLNKAKQSVDWKTVASVAVGLAAFGTAVYAISRTSKTGKKFASVVTGG
ncbi:hypothetical protein [Marinomonas phage MfV]|uniref:Uncharacterized protein n=2 Tax=root TaxID=1 RepID=A0A899ISL9_9VIRU|nr:hypothetical protein [Marinomonas phage MfV]